MKRVLIGAIIVLGLLLRVLWLDKYPVGFTADEASFGYDAYSILKTGKDQWGVSFPLSLRSFGDFKLPVYSYLTVPSVAVFGLNEFAVRLPAALLGTLAILFTYLMVTALLENYNFDAKSREFIALSSAFFLAISPWHISLSRGAFEANLTTFFIPLGVWAFVRGLAKPKWMILAALAFGINLFTYHSARFFTPILALILWFINRKRLTIKSLKLPLLVFLFFVVAASLSFFSGSSARGMDVAIFNPTGGWGAVSDRRYEAVLAGLPDLLARLFSNKVVYIFQQFSQNYLTYLSPQFLFTQGVNSASYGMVPGIGMIYLIELPLLIASLWYLARVRAQKGKVVSFFLFWVLTAPLIAALTKGSGYAGNRAAIMQPALSVLSGFGSWVIFVSLKEKIGKIVVIGVTLLCFVSLLFFLETYIFHAPNAVASEMLYGRKETIDFISEVKDSYRQIYVSRTLTEPQIFVAFYKKWNPLDYQNQTEAWMEYKTKGYIFLDLLDGYKLGKYRFGSLYYNENKNKAGILFVGKPEEFPDKITTLRTVNYPDGKPAILIVDPSSQSFAAK